MIQLERDVCGVEHVRGLEEAYCPLRPEQESPLVVSLELVERYLSYFPHMGEYRTLDRSIAWYRIL